LAAREAAVLASDPDRGYLGAGPWTTPARAMGRLLGFFLLVLLSVSLLRTVPVVGPWLGGFFGFWLTAIVLSLALTRLSVTLTRRRRIASELRLLGEVDSPHNQGKLGSLLLANSRPRAALPHLEAAAAGEPDVAEWRYRHGAALLGAGRASEARAELEAAVEIDEEHAYGAVLQALADARLRSGDAVGALQALDRFDRNHGESPESCYRRGQALRRLGRREAARESFRRVTRLASRAARFQRAQNRPWVWRSLLARLV
jgi:tetratricopeptide (TPR) repeat protein